MNTEKLFVDYDACLNLIILKIKDIDDIYDMKCDTELVMSSLEQQVGQLVDIIEYIEYEIETE